MNKALRKKKIILIIPLFIIGIILFNLIDFKPYNLTENDKELISYFNEVALNSEYGESAQRTSKWNKPMTLFISSDSVYPKQIEDIKQTVDLINNTIGNRMIEITNDSITANSHLYLCKKENLQKLNPEFASEVSEHSSGYFHFYWTKFEIENALIFINTSTPYKIHKSAILEELTQCLGLANDSEKYTDSVFYKWKIPDSIFTYDYNKMDIELIKLLYNPKMKVGLTSEESERIIKRILKNKEK